MLPCFLLIDFSHSYAIEHKTGIVCCKCEIRRRAVRDRGSRNGSRILATASWYLVGSCCEIDRRYIGKNVYLHLERVFAPARAIRDRVAADKRAESLSGYFKRVFLGGTSDAEGNSYGADRDVDYIESVSASTSRARNERPRDSLSLSTQHSKNQNSSFPIWLRFPLTPSHIHSRSRSLSQTPNALRKVPGRLHASHRFACAPTRMHRLRARIAWKVEIMRFSDFARAHTHAHTHACSTVWRLQRRAVCSSRPSLSRLHRGASDCHLSSFLSSAPASRND